MKNTTTSKIQMSPPVQKLVKLGVCSTSDIKDAVSKAEKLSTPEYQRKIRETERLLGMVGEANRIRILLLLSKREMCVCELESALKLPQPTISHNLGLLENAGLLERNKKGKFVFYSLIVSPLTKLLEEMLL
ncbi:MAG: helix-turn-helix transcriptional regulator [Nitrososphaerota archaeon]|nr:helix-turn-helix transcriptional regulator [Nitrososphaerota archaeon]MDG6924336.1 helix-turn-helix transcriptional regulator [Nitrososphaerota archaeon]